LNLPTISIIIPAYKESQTLVSLLSSINQDETEILVSIALGDKLSRKSAEPFDVVIVEGKQGRGNQLDKASKIAKGEILVFCHADTIMPKNWRKKVIETLAIPKVVAGAFSLSFNSGSRLLAFVSLMANLRAKYLGLPYGDQTLFTSAETYRKVGGFKPIPIMEDVEFVRDLKKIGRVKLINEKVATSARRYEKAGVIYSVLRNFFLLSLYFIGVSPKKLSQWYQ